MPDEIPVIKEPTSPTEPSVPVATPPVIPESKFTLERIDENNVRKITEHPDVSIVNIPSLTQSKDDLEKTIIELKEQLDQINEVLNEYKKLP
jgi:hypothetical protein